MLSSSYSPSLSSNVCSSFPRHFLHRRVLPPSLVGGEERRRRVREWQAESRDGAERGCKGEGGSGRGGSDRLGRRGGREAEASPHKRRLKCVTNISPRRLMTHLLHQMVHYRTTLRGSEQRSATIARITIHTHATILNIKRRSSESCAMRCLLRVTLIHRQGWVQDGTLLDVVRNEVWIFFCKN